MRNAIRRMVTLAMVLVVGSCGGKSGTEAVAERFIEAWKTYDIATLSALTAPDVVVDLGRGTLAGREHVIGPIEFSMGAGAEFEFNNVVVRGDTVEFEMIETSDIVRACGLEEIRHYPRLIFENGLLVRKESVRGIPNLRLYSEQLSLLRIWISDRRPDVLEQITDPRGGYRFTRRSGELMALMARAWQESKSIE